MDPVTAITINNNKRLTKTKSELFRDEYVNEDNYRKQFAALSTISALLAGFSFSSFSVFSHSLGHEFEGM